MPAHADVFRSSSVAVVALVTSGLLACSHSRPLDPEGAVLPYSYDLEKAEPLPPPFMARFQRDDANLFFVAAEHGCDRTTFRLIDDVLAAHAVRIVVFEGRPNSEGVNSVAYSRHFQEWAAADFCSGGGEGAYAAIQAAKRGASFVAGEPDEHTIVQAVLQQGYSTDDLLGFYFVRQIPQLRREGGLRTESIDASFRRVIVGVGKKSRLEEASATFSFEQFLTWYRKKEGNTFDVAAVDSEASAPIAAGKYVTQRISAVVGVVRDRFIVQVIANHLKTERNVLVVYGASHFTTQRPAFERLLGKPVEMRPGVARPQ